MAMRIPPSVLLPYQIRWIADPAPIKIIEKSRRIGISYAEAADNALTAARQDGTDVWMIGYNMEMTREYIRDVADWSRAFQLAASAVEECLLEDEDKDILTYRVKYASGHRVTALSSRPTNLRNKQGIVVLDEAAFHEDLEGLIKAAVALRIWGGKLRIISTHNGESNYFNTLIDECRSGKRPYSVHRCTFDEALIDGLYHRVCLRTGQPWSPTAEAAWREEIYADYGDAADEELGVIPSSGAGGYLPRALIEACMARDIPVLSLALPDSFALESEVARTGEIADWCTAHLAPLLARLPQHAQHFLGEDFGRTGDLSVLAPLTERVDLTYRTPFVVELRNVPFEAQKQLMFYLCDKLPHFRRGCFDGRGNGGYLAEVAKQRYGAQCIEVVQLSESWYREQMPKFKRGFEEQAIVIPQHADVMTDLRSLAMTKGVAKVPEGKHWQGADGRPRHGDAAIALAMAWTAAHSDVGPAAGTLTPQAPQQYHSERRRRTFGRHAA
jgi:phage FluMu gp28-like protein